MPRYPGAMSLIRRLLILTLALAVLVTGLQSAVARSEMAGATVQVLCAAQGVTVQAFDATGKPIPHRHACPHCLAAGQSWAPGPVPLAVPMRIATSGSLIPMAPIDLALAVRAAIMPEARAPPVTL